MQLVVSYPDDDIDAELLTQHLDYYIEDLRIELQKKRTQYSFINNELLGHEKSLFKTVQDLKEWKNSFLDSMSAYTDLNVDAAYAEARMEVSSTNVTKVSEDIEQASNARVEVVNRKRKELSDVLDAYKLNRENLGRQHQGLDREITHVRGRTLKSMILCKRSQEVKYLTNLVCF